MKIPIGTRFKCSISFDSKHPDVNFHFCREYCMYYNGDSNHPEQGFYCSYENNKTQRTNRGKKEHRRKK